MTPTHDGGNADSDCVFCKIVAGAIPSRQIYEDDHAVAFLDIGAWHRGHSLVVPRRHVPDLITGEPSFSDLSPAIDAVARLLIDKLAADGINLLSSTGSAAGQEVFHLHVHLVPRYADEPGLDKMIRRAPVSAEELDAVYRQIQGQG
jgi:histidine triad (HIT) family protein